MKRNMCIHVSAVPVSPVSVCLCVFVSVHISVFQLKNWTYFLFVCIFTLLSTILLCFCRQHTNTPYIRYFMYALTYEAHSCVEILWNSINKRINGNTYTFYWYEIGWLNLYDARLTYINLGMGKMGTLIRNTQTQAF